MKHVSAVVRALLASGAFSATKYVSPTEVVRATRRRVRGKVPNRGTVDLVMVMGRPNYRERAFIRKAKKAGEAFPVRKVQLRFAPGAKKRQ